MRVWLAGSRAFGAAVYDSLNNLEGVRVVGVTAPLDDPLWSKAAELGHRRLPQLPASYVEIWADLIVSAQNYAFISPAARAAAHYGAIGYHPSLLPRHRGKRAVEATIEAGDRIAGGTVYQMDDGWDTGPIILQDWCHVVPGWSAKDLWKEKLFPMGIRLLGSVISYMEQGGAWMFEQQDERVATTC